MKMIKFKRLTTFFEYNLDTENVEEVKKPTNEMAPYSPEKEEEVKMVAIDGKYTIEELSDPPPTKEEIMQADLLAIQDAMCEQDMLNEQKFSEIDMALCDLDTAGGI